MISRLFGGVISNELGLGRCWLGGQDVAEESYALGLIEEIEFERISRLLEKYSGTGMSLRVSLESFFWLLSSGAINLS